MTVATTGTVGKLPLRDAIKLTPLSTTRRSSTIASLSSLGGPQIPGPVMRIAPKPRRPTGNWVGVVWDDTFNLLVREIAIRHAPLRPGSGGGISYHSRPATTLS